jgi:hypothetical protein
MEFLDEILNLPYEEKMKLVALLWCWWTERNKSNHGERRLSPEETRAIVCRLTSEWAEFLIKQPAERQSRHTVWLPPPLECIKINLDGAFHLGTGRAGWGSIGRDHDSNIIFAGAGAIANIGEALASEAHALLQSINIADQLGIGRPIFVTDCQVLKQTVTSTNYDAAPLGALFREIKSRLRLCFIDFSIVYESRECNKPAHVLAAIGAAEPIGYHNVWLDDFPIDVTRAMYGDHAELS